MKYLLLIVSVLCLAISCGKRASIPKSGIYIGSMNVIRESANQWDGYKKSDTSYLDKIEVHHIKDSVFFNIGYTRAKFKWNASGEYTLMTGTHERETFTCSGEKIHYHSSSYGGSSSAYSQVSKDFTGIRQ